MKKYPLLITVIFALIGIVSVSKIFSRPSSEPVPEESGTVGKSETDPVSETEPSDTRSLPEETTGPETRPVGHVPFILQAPGGRWDDPVFQDGCEEASMLMASGWLKKTGPVTEEAAVDGIRSLAAFETTRFGHHEDVGLPEIIITLRERFDIGSAEIRNDVTPAELIAAVADGNLILAPVFGRALGNPNFTAPGPITHMLVVTGYDSGTEAFTTNDPGTVHGESYRYDGDVLFDALWAYPSGPTHPAPPTPSEREKSVIIVQATR